MLRLRLSSDALVCHPGPTYPLGSSLGSVANFVQEVLKGQLPLSAGGLRGEGVELFGRGEALLNSVFQLPFSQHVHQCNAGEGGLRGVKRFEPQHGTGDPLHASMVLLHNIIQIFRLVSDSR